MPNTKGMTASLAYQAPLLPEPSIIQTIRKEGFNYLLNRSSIKGTIYRYTAFADCEMLQIANCVFICFKGKRNA
jgi:hypothetical protein